MTESELRTKAARFLDAYKGITEGSSGHKELINMYNDSGLCPRYTMTIYDAWCAMAVSDCFIGTGLTSIFPCVECSCANMITLAQAAGIWIEDDSYVPKIGTVIMYDWDDSGYGDNTGVPDHVGIVQAISGTTITVIEGNKSDSVGTRSMQVNGKYIRGYIEPNYASLADTDSSIENNNGEATAYAEPSELWAYLYGKIGNPYGTAGLMGNLYAESAFIPINLQDSFEKKLGYTDETYTRVVDAGTYTKFTSDSAGYGLAQWTYSSRKAALLSFCQNRGASIGNLSAQLDYLWQELQNDFTSMLSKLKTATSVKNASDIVLTQFEMPGDQSDSVKNTRASYSQKYYDEFATIYSTEKKSIDEIAQEVIIGEWGNGEERKQALEAAGYDYDEVQAQVNNILGVTSSSSGSTSSGTSSSVASDEDASGIKYADCYENGYGSGHKYKVAAVSGLNLRKRPSTKNGEIISTLVYGTTVIYYGYYEIDSSGDKWLLVIGNGQTGWVSAKYLA